MSNGDDDNEDGQGTDADRRGEDASDEDGESGLEELLLGVRDLL